ncbi:MAG: sulfotransferase [Methylobacter tundripaludum]|uniref:Sulfotransferase n=1 Tax=Methylobacter tundripaludum TaxID=173365 RepID=A0A2S6GXT5_9GAMM|nr:sulfotransferase [Methylobacter tundripaludum]MCK9637586.1 sulfotransferase [Methylobacter tundripaludum]PPK70044.1 sulfotransferase [Methylobacter tundripaludum]
MPHYHFISGLPRSGSTLLAAILRQNPRFHGGMTSPVGSLFNAALAQMSAGSEFGAVVGVDQRRAVLRGLFTSFYESYPDEAVIFDTNRLWCTKLPALLDLFPEAKIIACVRNVAWVMDSIERLYRANPYENTRLFGNMQRSTVYNRLEGLAQHDQLVGFAWSALREAFYGEQAASMLLLDYDLLAQAPQKVLPLLYQFIGEPLFDHDFENVEYDAPQFDFQIGVEGLHRVRPKVEFQSRRTIIPPDLFEKYSQLSFWSDSAGSEAYVITAKPPEQGAAVLELKS